LAAKLSDEDVGAMLACIGDIFEITRVSNLTHCVNVTGRCLEPLRGSTILKQLYFTDYDDQNHHRETKLLEADVIPILDSIIDADGSVLHHILFPKIWREARSQLLVDFLFKYNRSMNARNIKCKAVKNPPDDLYSRCGKKCIGTSRHPWISKSKELFGVYNFTCFSCYGSYCGECADRYVVEELCERCETRYCIECIETLTCGICGISMLCFCSHYYMTF
jgi:hypothetical protein